MDKDPRGPSRCRLVPRESSLQGWVSSALGDTLTQMGSSCVCRKMSPNKGWVLTHSSPPGKPCIPTSGVAHPAGMQSHPGPHGPPPGRAQRDPSAPSGLCQSCSKKCWAGSLPCHGRTVTLLQKASALYINSDAQGSGRKRGAGAPHAHGLRLGSLVHVPRWSCTKLSSPRC